MMFLRSSGSSLGCLTNSTCMWMPFCCLFIKLFESQMSLSCLTDTSPTAPRISRECRELDQTGAQADTGDACSNQTSHTHYSEAKNKIQLNAMLVEGPLNSDYYTNATQKHTPTTAVVVVSDVPVDIVDGVRIDQHDLCSPHEEADIIITQRAISCSLSGKCVRSSRYCSVNAWRRQGNCYQNYQEGNILPL